MGESTAEVAGASRAAQAATIAEAFRITAADHPDRIAMRTKDDEVSLTWSQLRDRVDALAGGLARLGVGRGDTVALMLANRPEFAVADLAVVTLGATPYSIYATSSPDQIAYTVEDAGSRVAIVEEAFTGPFSAAAAQLPRLETVIVLEGARGEATIAWADVEGADPDFDGDAAAAAVAPDDLLTLIYTSGTTGPPKGVQLAHRNVMSAVRATQALVQFPDGSRVISWLPAAHIAERQAHHYLPIAYAMTVTCCPNPREITAYLPAVHPTWFFAVPRIFEKLRAGLEGFLLAGARVDAARNRSWLDASTRRVELLQAGAPVPEDLEATWAQADRELFSGLRGMLGLDELASVNVGAAPTPREVIVFFHAIGVPLAELWGMSETCGAGCCNPPDKVKIGTVGPAAPGVELRLGDDGELLMRSPVVMVGYRGQPERTAEAIDAGGWLHTGDIAVMDDDGYVTIVDRKKELIINAAGKNMSPANIESTLKGASPLIGQTCVIGDARPFNTALIVLDADFAPAWAALHGIEAGDLAALADAPAVREAVQADVDRANDKLARVEQIKRFTILPGDWAPGGEELTPTMKLKRKPIAAKYAEAIEAMYA
jgi:long-subunit acyl-CoA synthetase (AMP-forming)